MPEDARCAGLTLIGWLARRMDGEAASTDGVEHARQQIAQGICGGARAEFMPNGRAREIVTLVTETHVRASKGCPSSDVAPRVGVRAKKHSAA